VFEEVTPSAAQIDKDHVLVSPSAEAMPDADVPRLSAVASRWRSLAAEVPGMEPQMVVLVDLQSRTEPFLVQQLNCMLAEAGLAPVAYVSHLFGTMRARHTPEAQRKAMEEVAVQFCKKFGDEEMEVVAKQWRVLMDWRAKRVAFAHPLLGNSLNKDSLLELEQAVGTDANYASLKAAAHAMIEAAKKLLQ
jgi:hypothetical protein